MADFGHAHSGHRHAASGATVKDPVCGMNVDPATAKHQAEHGGQRYFFCSAGCKTKFEADPALYLKIAPAPVSTPAPVATSPMTAEGTIYTCPMHPQIRQVGPGNCPICGMTLEPLQVTAEAGHNPELADMTRRFWVGLALAIPVFLMEMGGHLFSSLHEILPPI